MVIQHNLSAFNTNRQLGMITKKISQSAEKLSSGYKINRAADDAAGLSISEKMRRQIRGLTQGVQNTEDGVSLCQVADGALTEIHEILQRINELSIQSANGTNSQSDRLHIQDEVDSLTAEIDRIAYTTSFNEHIFPLRGDGIIRKKIEGEGIGNVTGVKVDEIGNRWILPSQIQEFTLQFRTGDGSGSVTVDGINYNASQIGNIVDGKMTVIGFPSRIDNNRVLFWYEDAFGITDISLTYPLSFSLGTENYSLSLSDLKVNSDGKIYYTSKKSGKDIFLIAVLDQDGETWIGIGTAQDSNLTNQDYMRATPYANNSNNEDKDDIGSFEYSNITANNIWIQMGAEAGEGMNINVVNATIRGLGLEDVNVMTIKNSEKAIDLISKAIYKVSKYRSTFGAQQNRLEHGILINENIIENTTHAESQIRDTDMTEEMVRYSNYNILSQLGQSMLAQANQRNQAVLSLLA